MDLKEAYEVIKKEWHAAERKVKKLEKELEKFRKEGASDSRVQKLLSRSKASTKRFHNTNPSLIAIRNSMRKNEPKSKNLRTINTVLNLKTCI